MAGHAVRIVSPLPFVTNAPLRETCRGAVVRGDTSPPSMTVPQAVMSGRGVRGSITAVAAPRSKSTLHFGPLALPQAALASRIACRREPAPLSAVVVTREG